MTSFMNQTIKFIVKQPKPILGRFFNTLSFMEYIGARKIIKSQPQEKLHEDVLSHMYEEIRHAYVLKKAAMRFAPEICETYSAEALLAGSAAANYMKAVDKAAVEKFNEQDPWLCYLYTTLLVEERANQYYLLIDEALEAQGYSPIFRGILVEEERHLADITTALQQYPHSFERLPLLREIEAVAFDEYLSAMQIELKTESISLPV